MKNDRVSVNYLSRQFYHLKSWYKEIMIAYHGMIDLSLFAEDSWCSLNILQLNLKKVKELKRGIFEAINKKIQSLKTKLEVHSSNIKTL